MLQGGLVQEVEEPLDRRRKVGGRHFENCPEEVVHKLLDGPLGGEQPGQEDLRDGLVGPGRSCKGNTEYTYGLTVSKFSEIFS